MTQAKDRAATAEKRCGELEAKCVKLEQEAIGASRAYVAPGCRGGIKDEG